MGSAHRVLQRGLVSQPVLARGRMRRPTAHSRAPAHKEWDRVEVHPAVEGWRHMVLRTAATAHLHTSNAAEAKQTYDRHGLRAADWSHPRVELIRPQPMCQGGTSVAGHLTRPPDGQTASPPPPNQPCAHAAAKRSLTCLRACRAIQWQWPHTCHRRVSQPPAQSTDCGGDLGRGQLRDEPRRGPSRLARQASAPCADYDAD